jgi:alkanesulfonate monooxygenase SsuD/methylene tetrahydromethanopterin reductase-like flavin-dependent oxidoreductase (luciferase family)
MTDEPHAPLRRGSIAILLTPHDGAPQDTIAELLAQARLAEEAGADGVTFGEHHAGFAGYLPNPLQLATMALARTGRVWAAPFPLLLPLRPTGIVAEEAAWLAAAFPGRVALGVAVGAAPVDFAVADVPFEERAARYRTELPRLVALLRGGSEHTAGSDAAIAACRDRPVPVVSAATTLTGVRLAAASGAGILLDSFSPITRARELADAYRDAGGHGPIALSRRAWLGAPPRALADDEMSSYASFTPAAMQQRMHSDDTLIAHDHDGEAVAHGLRDAIDIVGADVLNLRLHIPGVTPDEVRTQLERFGAHVLPTLRR